MLHATLDRQLLIFMLLPVPIFWAVWLFGITEPKLTFSSILVVLILYPVIEEILFRGVIQVWLLNSINYDYRGISVANLITSFLFILAHSITGSPLWSAATFIPSLIFGYSFERYKSLKAPIFLHCYYNTGYYFMTTV